jgi:hypothetical protein
LRSKTGGRRESTTKSTKNGIWFNLQHLLLLEYKGVRLDCGYRMNLLVRDNLIISGDVVSRTGYYTPPSLKASSRQREHVRKGIHQVQLLTYMRLTGVKIGPLINFDVTNLESGIKHFIL